MEPGVMEQIKRAVSLEHPHSERPPKDAEKNSRPAAVLILLARDGAGRLNLLITRRTETVETHKGQMAFPGGMVEAGDPDLTFTALRETEEEVGISRADVTVLGSL